MYRSDCSCRKPFARESTRQRQPDANKSSPCETCGADFVLLRRPLHTSRFPDPRPALRPHLVPDGGVGRVEVHRRADGAVAQDDLFFSLAGCVERPHVADWCAGEGQI